MTAPRAAAAALCLALLAVARAEEAAPGGQPSAAGDPTAIFLGLVQVEGAERAGADGPLRATLELNPSGLAKVKGLREWFPDAAVSGGRVVLRLDGRAPASSRPPVRAQRGPTFLVDFDRPEAAPFRAELARRGTAPDAELARLVDGWIERKSMSRGIDSAARVVVRREGDCSEHAVLLAAAARLAGRASRVVVGIALVPVEGRLRGFGHAWTEIHDGRAWRTVDATPLPAGVRYLPLGTFADEGPGYLGAAWAALSPIDVRRVVLEAAPPR